MCEAIAQKAAHGYYFPGADDLDVLQEARVGVWKALRDWTSDGGSSFDGFAFMCARRQVLTALKAAQRDKHRMLDEAARLETPVNDDSETPTTLGDLIVRWNADPCRIVIAREEAFRLLGRMRRLSPWERECVQRVLIDGDEYDAVGDRKAVDNGVQRARKKLADQSHDYDPVVRLVKVYVDRTLHRTESQAARQALAVRNGRVVSISKRKLLDGRERAPQGRPTADGRRGLPVWRVDIREAA